MLNMSGEELVFNQMCGAEFIMSGQAQVVFVQPAFVNDLCQIDYLHSCFIFSPFQQVMRFAELTQEVQVARQAQVRFDNGLTPGRRRLNRQYKEAVAKMQEEGGMFFLSC